MNNKHISDDVMTYLEERKAEIRREVEKAMDNNDNYHETFYKGQKRLIQEIIRYLSEE